MDKIISNKKNLQILFEDNHIIVVNKRCGDIVQGDKTGDTPLSEIIKSFIKEKYNKPTFIISTKSGLGKGSARSIYGFDIGTAVIAAVQNKILIRGGGHKMAAGFTLDTDKISEFKNFLIRKFKSININLESKKKIFYDTEISPSAINIDFYEKINVLSPFGSGNPEP